MSRSHNRCWGARESDPEALPVLAPARQPCKSRRRNHDLQMCGLPMGGDEKRLHLCPNKQSAPAGQGDPQTFDSELLEGSSV